MAWRQACRRNIDPSQSRIVSRRAAHKAAWLFVVLALSASLLYPAHAMRRETLKLLTALGTHVIDVEIADTLEEKSQGLMFRTRLINMKALVSERMCHCRYRGGLRRP